MLEDLEKPQKIFMIVMYCLTAVALLFGCFSLYNLLAVEKPWTIGVTYADYLKKDGKDIPIINVKVNGNDNNNGLAVYDVQFNSYTDTEGNGIAGFGMQCIGDCYVFNSSNIDRNNSNTHNDLSGLTFFEKSAKLNSFKYNTYGKTKVYGDFYLYYTGDNNITYSCIDYNEVDDFLLIDIQGSKYRLVLKDYTYERNTGKKDYKFWPIIYDYVYEPTTTKFTWFEVFDIIIDRARTSSGKVDFEEFSLSLFDISTYVDIQYMDDKGQFHSLPETSEQRNYLTMPVEYNLDGALTAKDSLFKQVSGSPTWSFYQNTEVSDYWNANAELNLNETHLNYVETNEGYKAEIKKDFAEYLKTLTNADIIFNINLGNVKYNVSSFDFNNFDFKMESISIITSKTQSSFKLFNTDKCSVSPKINYGGSND